MRRRHAPRIFGVAIGLLIAATLAVYFYQRNGSTPVAPASDPAAAVPATEPLETEIASALILGPSVAKASEAVQRELDHLDPAADGWDTEAFSDRASSQLQLLAKAIRSEPTETAKPPLEKLLAGDFTCGNLRPAALNRVFSDGQLAVSRGERGVADQAQEVYRGEEGLHQAVRSLLVPWNGNAGANLRATFKIVLVDASDDAVTTTVQVQIAGPTSTGSVQQSATWMCRWQHASAAAEPLLSVIEVEQFEEVTFNGKHGTLLRESTDAVLGGNSTYRDQFGHDIDHWQSRLDWRLGLDMVGPHGLAVGDVNGDGLDDLYVCEPGGLPNRLFVQRDDGTATDVSSAAGLDWLEPTASALLVDIDNDGDQDLVFASGRLLVSCENQGNATFQRRTVLTMSGTARSLAAADFNNDGKLDLYVCCHFHHANSIAGIGLALPIPYHDANNGPPNYLFANQGGWQFKDVTAAVGLDVNNRRFSFAATWEDYDNDGDMDLYVANDFGRNNLYRNDGGRFVDVAASAGVEDMASGMSVSWGDYNRDGQLDLYVANMFSTAGNRVMNQLRFRSETDEAERGVFRRFARGNTLFANNGDGTFRDVSLEAGVNMGRWAWGSLFADLNNDGWQDIVSANGMITSADDPGDL